MKKELVAKRIDMSFQAETKELLNIMVNSLYTHREIFLRELISNASDALDKLHFNSITDQNLLENDPNLKINISINRVEKTLTITDNGIGMTYEEVIEHIGTIARSGSKSFVESLKKSNAQSEIDLIGKFGVGFYSVFMIADNVEIYTRAAGSNHEDGVYWTSKGDGLFSIEKLHKSERGTEIILHLRKDCYRTSDPSEDFSNQYTIQNLVEKYSNYIKYPINMDFYIEDFQTSTGEGNKEKPVITVENRILNSMTPIWKKDKKDFKQEDYFQFYKHQFHDWNEYADVIHFKLEGKVEFTALLFIPLKATSDLYNREFSKGIDLYCNDVFVMKDCKNLLPDHFRFVRGLIDSPDFSLNISREILQHDKQLKIIEKNLEKKVLESLQKLLKNERKKYEQLWVDFGKAIKGGIYMDYKNKESLKDLLLFNSSAVAEGMTTLKEYADRMPEGQKEIYYAAAKDIDTIQKMPQLEIFRENEIETLFFTDKIDEFLTQNLDEYNGKKLVSITRENFNLEKIKKKITEDRKMPEGNPDDQNLLDCVKKILKEKVNDVKISNRLISSPVCLVSSNTGMTFNMEQLLKGVNQPVGKAARILEINPKHKLYVVLRKIYEKDKDSEEMQNYCNILYYQAILMEGYEIENPVDFANTLSELMVRNYEKQL